MPFPLPSAVAVPASAAHASLLLQVLRWWGFSDAFRNEMVFPLTALFFGTGNQVGAGAGRLLLLKGGNLCGCCYGQAVGFTGRSSALQR